MRWYSTMGATGYRVRWGTVTGSYPHSSAVLPADARQWSITGLVTEQTCYVVVQAEYNGLWRPLSEAVSIATLQWHSEYRTTIVDLEVTFCNVVSHVFPSLSLMTCNQCRFMSYLPGGSYGHLRFLIAQKTSLFRA